MLRLDDILGVLERERVLGLPGVDLFIPIRIAGEILRRAFVAGLIEELVEARQGVFEIAQDRETDGFVFVDLGIVDVDVNDFAVFAEFLDLACDAVVEPHADGEQEVGFVDGIVCIDSAVHAEPLERESVSLGKSTDAHERGGHRNLGALGELKQLG